MNGVEILSSETIYNTILPEWCITAGLICAMVFIFLMVFCFSNDHMIIGLICIVIALIVGIVGSLGGTLSKTDISHIEYKVTIDDSVSMNDFLDKYEILDQEGKIYTVRERE